MRTIILKIAALGLVHTILLLLVNHISVSLWGRPRGVNFGITLYYQATFLTAFGFVLIGMFFLAGPKTAFACSVVAILTLVYVFFPGAALHLFFAMPITSLAFFVLLWLGMDWRQRRAMP